MAQNKKYKTNLRIIVSLFHGHITSFVHDYLNMYIGSSFRNRPTASTSPEQISGASLELAWSKVDTSTSAKELASWTSYHEVSMR
jgi:hypothetical protein